MKQQEKIGLIFIFAFLFLNLIFSQLISPIYGEMMNGHKKSTISFLQKIKDLPEYKKILEMNNNIYGNTVKEEIIKKESDKKELINNLEQKLMINPRSRDILYSLYLLNKDEGNDLIAENYLKQAKEVDPSLK